MKLYDLLLSSGMINEFMTSVTAAAVLTLWGLNFCFTRICGLSSLPLNYRLGPLGTRTIMWRISLADNFTPLPKHPIGTEWFGVGIRKSCSRNGKNWKLKTLCLCQGFPLFSIVWQKNTRKNTKNLLNTPMCSDISKLSKTFSMFVSRSILTPMANANIFFNRKC